MLPYKCCPLNGFTDSTANPLHFPTPVSQYRSAYTFRIEILSLRQISKADGFILCFSQQICYERARFDATVSLNSSTESIFFYNNVRATAFKDTFIAAHCSTPHKIAEVDDPNLSICVNKTLSPVPARTGRRSLSRGLTSDLWDICTDDLPLN